MMAGTTNKPLNPFRKQESSDSFKSLHSRWGDVAITVPTEGSWSQYNTPNCRNRSHRRAFYGTDYVPEHSARHRHGHLALDEKNAGSKASADISTSSRRNSFISNNLNPHHVSMRRQLSFRHRSSRSLPIVDGTFEETEPLITERRNEFAYKPIQQDYPTEIAGSQGSQLRRTNTARFRYIPATARYREELREIPQRNRSASSPGSDQRPVWHGKPAGKRASVASSSSSKFLTTAMVPDSEDIYG